MSASAVTTSDGVDLEARWDHPAADQRGTVVFCHPHPQQGGTMHAPLIVAVTRRLTEAGFAVLRFNFRGVGSSGGAWDGGHGELHDVAATVGAARSSFPDLETGLVGWSFGAATSLRWLGATGVSLPWVGIGLPVSPALTLELPAAGDLAAAPRTFIIGDRDQFTTVDELTGYAVKVGGAVEVVRGSDHFFHFKEDRVAELVASGLYSEPENTR